MKTRLLLLITLLSALALGFACGGAATNSTANNANGTRIPLSMSNMTSNTSSPMPVNAMPGNITPGNKISSAANKMAPSAAAVDTDEAPATTGKKPPKGATALCKDGTYSMSKTDSGQCSGHGGVDKKL